MYTELVRPLCSLLPVPGVLGPHKKITPDHSLIVKQKEKNAFIPCCKQVEDDTLLEHVTKNVTSDDPPGGCPAAGLSNFRSS
jgi:hypothetical protein